MLSSNIDDYLKKGKIRLSIEPAIRSVRIELEQVGKRDNMVIETAN
jgi:hypothetical protein